MYRRRLRVSKFIHFRIERRDSTKHLDYGDFIADAHVTYKLKIEAEKILENSQGAHFQFLRFLHL